MSSSSRLLLKRRLREAAVELSQRGLSFAARFASEQIIGMSDEIDDTQLQPEEEPCNQKDNDLLLFARSLVSLGEFQRCAHLIRARKGVGLFATETTLSKALLELRFLSSYCLYMAGEKRRSQAEAETETNGGNPFLLEIFKELMPLYFYDSSRKEIDQEHTKKGRQLDSFLLYVLGVVVRDLHAYGFGSHVTVQLPSQNVLPIEALPSAEDLLMESAWLYPYNWSCWIELANMHMKQQKDAPLWPPQISAHCSKIELESDAELKSVMFQLFLVHLFLKQQNGEQALQILTTLVPWFPGSPHIDTQIALSHFWLLEYDQAQVRFEGVREVDPYRLEHLDTYSNILYIKERKAELSYLAHTMTKVDKFAPETSCVIANYYSLKGNHEKSIQYFQRALRQNHANLAAWTLMGHECIECHNLSAAVQCYRKAIEVSPLDHRAWYGLGQTYEILHLYQYALYYYKKATALRPSDHRMWCAVASCLCKLSQKQEAINAFEQAASFDDHEGLALRDLARLYRDEGKTGLASLSYFRYLLNCSSQEWPSTLIFGVQDLKELKNALSHYDEVIGQNKRNGGFHSISTFQFQFQKCPLDFPQDILDGIDLDPEKVEAVLFVAQFCRECGFIDSATRYCNRLLDYGGQETTIAKALLRDMRFSLGNLSTKGVSEDFSVRSMEMESSVIGSEEGISMSADESFSVGPDRLEGELLDDDNEDDETGN